MRKHDMSELEAGGSAVGSVHKTDDGDSVVDLLREIRDNLASQHAELLDTEAACRLLGISRSTFDRLRSKGELPPPVVLAGTITRWRRRELIKWIETGCAAPK